MKAKMQTMKTTEGASAKSFEPLVLDTRPIFARGESPCGPIDDCVASLKPGQNFVLLASFEPAPLYMKLGREGFTHKTKLLPDGTWRVEFSKTPE